MAGEGRRGSAASSLLTEISGAPSVTEDEIAGLSVEQLESVGGELQALCSLLQAELDLYTRYLSSQVQDEPGTTQGTLTTAPSGSGTATPSVSSLDVRGLRRGQVVTRGRRRAAGRLSERQKCRLWQRELEIVLANKRKQENMWLQELHKYQVSVLEAEARQKDLENAQEGLGRLTAGPRRQLNFEQVHRFMEEQLRVWLKQASQVWVQVSLLRADLAKARARRERRQGGYDPTGQPVSQINFLKQQLEHSNMKDRVERNRGVLATLLRQLERERRRAVALEEENQDRVARREEVNHSIEVAERELNRLSLTCSRVATRVKETSARLNAKILALKSSGNQKTSVRDYLRLSDDVKKLKKEAALWRRKVEDCN